MTALVWFRRDLRLVDNPAWADATAGHDRVVALFVLDPVLWRPGTRRSDVLAGHLAALDTSLRALGGRLLVRTGPPADIVVTEAAACDAVFVNADYSPHATARDRAVAEALGALGVEMAVHHGSVVHRPGSVMTGAGAPYRVFGAFFRRWMDTAVEDAPRGGAAVVADDAGEGPPPMSAPGGGGEDVALARLEDLLTRVDRYDTDGQRPDLAATSGLSADLKFGTISPRRVLEEVGTASDGRLAFVRQLAWRDFNTHCLFHWPGIVDAPFDAATGGVEWLDDETGWRAWCEGRTGYPIVDAAMRQLAAEGWLHNRVRMIAASFLTKDLLIDWRRGEREFRRLLVDGDVANNVANWQWVAGTGLDAAPYFRVLNPVRQAVRFDPDGTYTRRWVPELSGLGAPHIHSPWTAPPAVLDAAGVELGATYPGPIVDHGAARTRALDAYGRARSRV